MINQKVLIEISKILSNNNIIWGIGGSYLLQLYNLYSNPDDLDLWIKPTDMEKVKKIFENYEEIKTHIPIPPELHFKINYNDVEIDFVACFIVRPNKNKFIYHIRPENIRTFDMIDGTKIPCTYLEDWYIVYRLLKRDDKAEIIKNFFYKNKKSFSKKILQLSLNNPENKIPKKITRDVENLIWSTLQLSLYDIVEFQEE